MTTLTASDAAFANLKPGDVYQIEITTEDIDRAVARNTGYEMHHAFDFACRRQIGLVGEVKNTGSVMINGGGLGTLAAEDAAAIRSNIREPRTVTVNVTAGPTA